MKNGVSGTGDIPIEPVKHGPDILLEMIKIRKLELWLLPLKKYRYKTN